MIPVNDRVLTKNECPYGSLFDGGTRKHCCCWKPDNQGCCWWRGPWKFSHVLHASAAVVLSNRHRPLNHLKQEGKMLFSVQNVVFFFPAEITSCVQQAFGWHSLVIWTCPQWWIWHLVAVLCQVDRCPAREGSHTVAPYSIADLTSERYAFCWHDVGQFFRLRRRKSIVELAFLEIFLTSSENSTPRYGLLEPRWRMVSSSEFKYNWKADPTGPEAVVKVF